MRFLGDRSPVLGFLVTPETLLRDIMKAVSILGCVLLLAACDPKTSSNSIASKIESIRTVANGQPEDVELIEATDQPMVDGAGKQVSAEQYSCTQVKHLWLVRFTGKQQIKILKVECAEGDYQLTIFDQKAFIKPWTGVLLGN